MLRAKEKRAGEELRMTNDEFGMKREEATAGSGPSAIEAAPSTTPVVSDLPDALPDEEESLAARLRKRRKV